MSPRQSLLGWGTVLIAVSFLSASVMLEPDRSGAAPQAADSQTPIAPHAFIPAEAIFYVSWEGGKEDAKAFKKTAAYQAIYESGLADSVNQFLSELLDRAGKKGKLIDNVLATVGNQGFSLAVTSAQGSPAPWGVLVLHDAAKLEPKLAKAIKAGVPEESRLGFDEVEVAGRQVTVVHHPQIPVGELSWWTEGGHLVIAAGLNATRQVISVLDGETDNLTSSRLYKGPEDLPFAENCVVWLDVERLLEVVGKIRVPSPDTGDPSIPVSELAAAFGLDDIRSFVFRSGFAGEAIRSRCRLELAKDADGIGVLFHPPAFSLADLPPLPESTTSFSASAFDAGAIYDYVKQVRQAFRRIGPESANRELDKILETVRQEIDVNFKQDLLEPLGNLAVGYVDSGQSPFFYGMTAIVAVDDAETLRGSLDTILGKLAERFGPKKLSIQRTSMHGEEVVTLELARGVFNPSFVVTDDWLTVSLIPQAVEAFLLRAEGTLPRWEASPAVKEGLATMPDQYTGLQIAKPTAGIRAIYGILPIIVPAIRTGISRETPGAPIEWNLASLPPTELVTEPLFPNVSVTTSEGNAVLCRSRSSLPYVGAGNLNVGTTAVLVSLLLPAVQSARSAARRAQSQNNLKQIGLSLHNYHDTYNHFPTGTVEESANKVKERLSWQSQILPFLERKALYQKLDEDSAWDSQANEEIVDTRIPTYVNPSIPVIKVVGDPAPTHYVGIGGLGKKGPTLPASDPKAGMFAYEKARTFADVTDGLSNTLMVSEVTGESAGPWAQGGKSTVRAFTKKPYVNGPDGIGSPYPGGCHMLFGDGHVEFISENIDPEVLEAMATISGGE